MSKGKASWKGRGFTSTVFFCMMVVFLSGIAMALMAAPPVTVKLWNWNIHDKKYQQKMYKLFNERHPDIKIEFSSISNTVYATVLEAAFVAGEPPDLFYPSGTMTFENLFKKGWIRPLNDCAPTPEELKSWMAQFPPYLNRFTEGAGVVNGKPYIVGLLGITGGAGFPMYYNKTVFKDAGIAKPPATQSELRATAAKITQAGQGAYFGASHGMRYRPQHWDQDFVGSLAHAAGVLGKEGPGAPPSWKDGRYHQSDPAFQKAFEVWIGMRADGSVYPGEETMEDEQAKMVFATNKAAIFFGGDWVVGNVLSYNPDADFDLELPPTPDDGIRRGLAWWVPPRGAFGYTVSNFGKNPRAVWEVIKFISSAEYQKGYVQGGFGISYLPEANRPENFHVKQLYRFVQWMEDPSLRREAPLRIIETDLALAEFPPVYPIWADVLDNIYLGKAGMETLKDFEDKMNAGLDVAIKKAQENGVKVTRADFAFPDWDPTKDYVQKKR